MGTGRGVLGIVLAGTPAGTQCPVLDVECIEGEVSARMRKARVLRIASILSPAASCPVVAENDALFVFLVYFSFISVF